MKSDATTQSSSTARAARPDDLAGSVREPLSSNAPHGDQQPIFLEACRAERALAEAADGLTQMVKAITELDLAAHFQPLLEVTRLVSRIRQLGLHVHQFRLEIGNREQQVGHGQLQLSVTRFLARLHQGAREFHRPVNELEHGTFFAWCAIELLNWMERIDLVPMEMQDMAVEMLEQAIRLAGRAGRKDTPASIAEASEEGR